MMEWRPIPGFEGAYEVSDAGEVRSLARVVLRSNGIKQTVRERRMKLTRSKTGYYTVSLSQPGASSVTHNVHALVAAAFLDDPPAEGDWHVDHIDFDRTNNTPGNLRWLPMLENSFRHNTEGNDGRDSGGFEDEWDEEGF